MIRIKIGVFHPTIDWYGGAEVVAAASANALAQNGYETLLIVNSPVQQKNIKKMVGEALSPSIKIIVDPPIFSPRGRLHAYESAFRTLISKGKCDMIFDTYSNCLFPWSKIVYVHFPFIYKEESCFRSSNPNKLGFSDAILRPYIFFEEYFENKENKLVFANSQFTARAVVKTLKVQPKVLYPPIPNFFFSYKEKKAQALYREDLVVTVARFGPGKGVELVPEIARLTDKKIKFIMIGLAHDQNVIKLLRDKIKRYGLGERVILIQNAPREEINSYLSKAKIYLHTMKNEHFGISIAEAMLLGCIPVVHNSGGAPEFVPDQYRYNTISEAASAINKEVNDWNHDVTVILRSIAERFSESNYSKALVSYISEYLGN